MHDIVIRGGTIVDGYDMTICSGTPIFEKGQETGARPGKLVRSAAE